MWNNQKGRKHCIHVGAHPSQQRLRFRCTCALVLWMPAVHAAAAVCLCADVLRLSGCPTLSSELLLCSPAPGVASSEEGQHMFYTSLSHTVRAEWSNPFICLHLFTLQETIWCNKESYFQICMTHFYVVNEHLHQNVKVFSVLQNKPLYLFSLLTSPKRLSMGDAFLQSTQCSLELFFTAAGLLQLLG